MGKAHSGRGHDVLDNASAHPDALLIATSMNGVVLSKRISPDRMIPYDRAARFHFGWRRVADLDALADLLSELSRTPRRCVLRGAVIDPTRTRYQSRLIARRIDEATGEIIEPTLRDVPRTWVALDLDGAAIPTGVDLLDLPALARLIVAQRLPALDGVGCVVQATASHGLKPGAYLRLWYRLDQPRNCAALRRAFSRTSVDLSLFTPNQPHYTAAPIFHGIDDPLGRMRLALLPGEPFARLVVPPPPRVAPPSSSAPRSDAEAIVSIQRILARLRQAKHGERHNLTLWGSARLGEMVAENVLSEEQAVRLIVNAIRASGSIDEPKTERTARDGVRLGRDDAERVAAALRDAQDYSPTRMTELEKALQETTYAE